MGCLQLGLFARGMYSVTIGVLSLIVQINRLYNNVYAYLTLLSGSRSGTQFPLDPDRETLIGRGADCQISLPDPLCSRVHAILHKEESRWVICDQGSRNGTSVNGQKTRDATLDEGHQIRVGSNDFEFHLSNSPDTTAANECKITQTIVLDQSVAAPRNSAEVLAALPTSEQVQELILLYQLSMRLLGCNEPEKVVRVALGLLKERTKAAVVGFLWVDDEGQLRPKLVIPQEAAQQVVLSQSLTELVLRQGHAVWVANQTAKGQISPDQEIRGHLNSGNKGSGSKDAGSKAGSKGKLRGQKEPSGSQAEEHFADAVCAPLVLKGDDGERTTLGAIHVYLEAGRFRQSDFDFIIAVANLVVIGLVRARAHTSLERDYERLVSDSPGYDELIGQSKLMLELKEKIKRVGRAPGGVLIVGESGTGKELVARAIHHHSPRADRPMVAVNCAAIPANLIESHLFGHVKGAFTGADRDHAGYFQQADLGTLFLDEVGELSLEGQAKLLRVLEGHPFLPVGSTQEIHADVRLIAATNRDLQSLVKKKEFREDLYYRLSVFELLLPPLRDRGEDLDLLIDFFLTHYRVEHGRPNLKLSKPAQKKLQAYAWPGNVRQLRNILDSAVVLATGDEIGPHDLGLRDQGGGPLESLEIAVWEKKLIVESLRRTRGNVPEAAKLLGIGRATLYRKIEHYEIDR